MALPHGAVRAPCHPDASLPSAGSEERNFTLVRLRVAEPSPPVTHVHVGGAGEGQAIGAGCVVISPRRRKATLPLILEEGLREGGPGWTNWN